jgi:4-hydroxythreonine-4-phosphate dehydrogenase
MSSATSRPILSLAMGDPCGISPELTVRIINDAEARQAAQLIVIGDRRILADGEGVVGATADITTWATGAPINNDGRAVFVDLGNLDPVHVTRGVSSREGGAFALMNFRAALRLAANGAADAATFTPFNKHAMKLAHDQYEDEIAIITEESGATETGREFNILEGLWNARVTSHVPIKDVARYITRDAVLNGIKMTERCMRGAGIANPRIAVAGLNPHAGDGGNFGREEIDEIEPAVLAAKAQGILCEGPFPSDTVFLRARRGDFDAVQTMYHDQGQIAMKLIGFDKGVTLIGGYAFPVCTPAHGTAYDIAGQGKANLGATRNAVLIAARMAKRSDISGEARGRLVAEIANRALSKAA